MALKLKEEQGKLSPPSSLALHPCDVTRTSVESKVQLLLACPKFGGKATVSSANSHPTPPHPTPSDHVTLLQVSPMPGSYLSTENKTWILPTAKAHKPQDWRTLQSTVAQGTSWEQLQETHGDHTARKMGDQHKGWGGKAGLSTKQQPHLVYIQLVVQQIMCSL